MKQTMKMIARLIVWRKRNDCPLAVKRLKKIVALIESGGLIPLAQSHRELAAGGPVLVERHRGTRYQLTPSGYLYSDHGMVDYVDRTVPGYVQAPSRQPRDGETFYFRPLGRMTACIKVHRSRLGPVVEPYIVD